MYQIHEVCESSRLSRKAVRLYEEKGLVHPKRVQGNRVYSKEDVLRLHCISYYRRLGFSLEQIEQLLDGGSEACVEELLQKRRDQIDQGIEKKQYQLNAFGRIIKAIQNHEKFDITETALDFQDDDSVEGTLIWKWNNLYQVYNYHCSRRTYWHALLSTRLFCVLLVIILLVALLEKGGLLG